MGSNKMSIAIVVGTRPETIKMAPIIRELTKRSLPFHFIHTGQHYDYNMSLQFIKELNLLDPDHSFKLTNKKPASQIAQMMTKLEKILAKLRPKILLLEGDTNTIVAGALTAIKLGLKVGHVEAGLRSYDWRMPEEHNRRMVDHISDILFAPTERAKRNLTQEHVYGKVYVTGNTVIDAVIQHMPLAEKHSKITDSIIFNEYALATIHRAENVDNATVLKSFAEAFLESPIPIVFPTHPRTTKKLKQRHLLKKLTNSKNIQLLPPQGYFDFLILMKNCKLILTDSGGIQEEATAPLIRKPVLVLRLSTERPEAVDAGFAKVVGVTKKKIIHALNAQLNNSAQLPFTSPFGNGKASEKIVNIVSGIV
jgi:UDP-N-acetylglucosamine 2-epimerase (non-hydrolysing)